MDYSPEKRINLALDTLRNELIEMRNIDIMILRQLMNIHETIQTLMKSKVVITRTQSCQNCSFHNKLTKLTSFKEDRSIIRQQSTPSFCNLSSSCSSLEDSLSPVKGMFYLAESDEHLYKEDQSTILPDNFNNNNKNKCSLSFTEEKIDIQKYEDLLRNNIREWKSSNSLTTPNREFTCIYSLSPVKGMFYLAESDEHLYKEDQSTILPDNFNNNNKNKCSLSFAEEKIDIQKYEDLLRNNIREWKSSNSLTTPNREFTCICNSF